MAIPPHNFFEELERRNVYRAAIGYAVFAWLLFGVPEAFLNIKGCSVRYLGSVVLDT
jgi:hypothetical protein